MSIKLLVRFNQNQHISQKNYSLKNIKPFHFYDEVMKGLILVE